MTILLHVQGTWNIIRLKEKPKICNQPLEGDSKNDRTALLTESRANAKCYQNESMFPEANNESTENVSSHHDETVKISTSLTNYTNAAGLPSSNVSKEQEKNNSTSIIATVTNQTKNNGSSTLQSSPSTFTTVTILNSTTETTSSFHATKALELVSTKAPETGGIKVNETKHDLKD